MTTSHELGQKRILSNNPYDTIRHMTRLHRKWWVLRSLRNECRAHVVTLPIESLYTNTKASVAREALVKQLVRKSVDRFSSLLFWRKKDNDKKSKRRALEYNSIFDETIREGLVHIDPPNSMVDNGQILNPQGRPFFRTTDLGDKYISEFWYRTYLDNAYAKAIIITLITAAATGLVGSYIKQIFKEVNQPSTINVYPTINMTEVQPRK